MKKTTFSVMLFLVLLALMTGCGSGGVDATKGDSTNPTPTKSAITTTTGRAATPTDPTAPASAPK